MEDINNKKILTELLNAINGNVLDVKNVPTVNMQIMELKQQARKEIENVTHGYKNKIESKIYSDTKLMDDLIKQRLEEIDSQNQRNINGYYEKYAKQLSSDTEYSEIRKKLLLDTNEEYRLFNQRSKQLFDKLDQIDEKIEKLEKMTYYTRFKSIISTFIGLALPTITVAVLIVFTLVWLFNH